MGFRDSVLRALGRGGEFARLEREFRLTHHEMEEVVAKILREYKRGLKGDPEATIRMLPSYVTHVPDGTERGVFYALDLGGTNFRVTRFMFDGKGGVYQSDEAKFTIPEDKMTSTREDLFDFLAACVAELQVDEAEGVKRTYGFTFSFPVQQTAVDKGTLIKWTKGFTASGVVDQDVVQLLKNAFARSGYDGQVVALVNDTVGTLVSSAYVDPSTMIGVILGTGTNAAYREDVKRITKLPKEMRKQGGEMVVNTEWGAYGSKPGQLPVNEVDRTIDAASVNPGEQILEKMISGMYLGEMVRIALVRLHKAKQIWSGATVPAALQESGSFPTPLLSECDRDNSPDLAVIAKVEEDFGVKGSTLLDRKRLKEICSVVVERAARLTACAIAATIRQIGPERGEGCTVGIDGSLYQFHPSFRQRLVRALDQLDAKCQVVLAQDGSGRGAALIACGVVNAAAV